tara:strand:- start:128 stop:679 length:552 start_codon:yes stop_codon:yes gene_type:complete
MSDYNNGLIYKITVTDDYIYVGSSCDFDERKRDHKSHIYNENSVKYNRKLYKTIRENNGQFNIETDMEILHYFPCNNKTELEEEEQRVMNELNPKLNMIKAHRTAEEIKETIRVNIKKWREKNIEEVRKSNRIRQRKRVNCPFCNKEMRYDSLTNHKKNHCKSIARTEVPLLEQEQVDHAKQK